MRVLVCGGRDFREQQVVWSALDAIDTGARLIELVATGGCSGADLLAERWCKERSCRSDVYQANWREHGKAAGPKRNQFMLDNVKPHMVLAFPGGRGTADMVRRAKAAGVQVREVTP